VSFTDRLAARARGLGPRLIAALPHPFADRGGPDPIELTDERVAPELAPAGRLASAARDQADAVEAVAPHSSVHSAPVATSSAERAARSGSRSRVVDSNTSPAQPALAPLAPHAGPPATNRALPDVVVADRPTREVHHHEQLRERTVEHHHHHHATAAEPRSRPAPTVRPVARPERPFEVGGRLDPRAAPAPPAAPAAALPPIHVHIGRIVVAPEPPRASRPRRERAPAVAPKSLAEHLDDRRSRR
jgi:hypothetical protein